MYQETIRTIILSVGWPLLITGSIFFIFKALKFNQKLNRLALGKLVLIQTCGSIISMVLLGAVSTAFMFCNVQKAVIIVIPVFLLWLITMILINRASSKLSEESAKINILYYKIKERTKQLEQEKNKLSHIATNMTTGAILLDQKGKAMFINKEAKNLVHISGNKEQEILGAIYEKFSKYNLKEKAEQCVKGIPTNILDAESDGKIYEIFLRCLSDHKFSENGYFGHFIWIRDASQEKLLEKSREKFIDVASHKLRTPLTVIKSSVEFLNTKELGKLNDKQKEIVSKVNDSANELVDMVNQLITAIEIQNQEFKPVKKTTDIKELINILIEKFSKNEKNKNVSIKLLTKLQNAEVSTDPELLKKALESVIENSIIYASQKEQAKIIIEIKKEKTGLIISVKDNGIGISKENQPMIFKKFFRGENALKIHTEGIGLSLCNAKNIIDSLNGKISFESEENNGTTFFIELPQN